MQPNELMITKASGIRAPFSQEKLMQSLSRSGASKNVIGLVIEAVHKKLYDGISTKEIYKLAFDLLKKYAKPIAPRYKLKVAIMELGPTGYPFEKFIGELLKHNGFNVKVGVIVEGQCVKHEIDVIAEKENNRFMIECKYHLAQGVICNVKISLYVAARFRDVKSAWENQPGGEKQFHQGWLVTNTRFSTDAIQYGLCAGLHLLGWNFPAKESLNHLIEKSGLYPLTCLTTLSRKEKQSLLDNNIVLCRELRDNPALLNIALIGETRKIKIIQELQFLGNEKH